MALLGLENLRTDPRFEEKWGAIRGIEKQIQALVRSPEVEAPEKGLK